MADPFINKTPERRLFREIQIGLSLFFMLFIAIVIWGYMKFSQDDHGIPQHIRNAPVAKHVGPEYYSQQWIAAQQNANSDDQTLPPRQPKIQTQTNPQPRLTDSQTNNVPSNSTLASTDVVAAKIVENASADDSTGFSTKSDDAPMTGFDRNFIRPNNQTTKTEPKSSDISRDLFSPAPANSGVQGTPTVVQASGTQITTFDASNEFAPVAQNDTVPEPNPEQEVDIFENSGDNSFGQNIAPPRKDQSEQSFAPIQTVDSNVPRPDKFTAKDTVAEDVPNQPPRSRETDVDLPVERSNDELNIYTTRPNDSFWSIAQTVYGDGRYFRALYELNRQLIDDYENIPPSTDLQIPPVEMLQSRFKDLCPADLLVKSPSNKENTYLTVEGDTLFDIARQRTGQAFRYLELLELNRDRLPADVNHLTRLAANIELQLPKRF